jgi:hypothetical protein
MGPAVRLDSLRRLVHRQAAQVTFRMEYGYGRYQRTRLTMRVTPELNAITRSILWHTQHNKTQRNATTHTERSRRKYSVEILNTSTVCVHVMYAQVGRS